MAPESHKLGPTSMLFYASLNIVGHVDPKPPSPLWHDVIYGRPNNSQIRLAFFAAPLNITNILKHTEGT